MPGDRDVVNGTQTRQYLRSSVYRICAWSSLALVVASFLVPGHRVLFIFGSAAVWFGATLPVLRLVPYGRRLDIHNQQDKRFLFFVCVYVALTLVAACLVVYFGSRH